MHLKLSAIGHLGRDPEMSYTPAGQSITRFSVATSRRWTDKGSGEKREETTWLNCTAWGQLAETSSQYLHKGSKVYIEGRPAVHAWIGKQNDAQASLDVTVNDLVMLDPKGAGAGQGDVSDDAGASTADVPF